MVQVTEECSVQMCKEERDALYTLCWERLNEPTDDPVVTDAVLVMFTLIGRYDAAARYINEHLARIEGNLSAE